MSHRILVVDDEPDMRLILGMTLQIGGHDVTEAETGEEALALMSQQDFDIVLLDLNLPDKSGLDVLDELQTAGRVPGLPVLILTADAREHLDQETARRGGRACLRKPVSSDSLLMTIEKEIASAATVDDR